MEIFRRKESQNPDKVPMKRDQGVNTMMTRISAGSHKKTSNLYSFK
jgi:hypothetical protein